MKGRRDKVSKMRGKREVERKTAIKTDIKRRQIKTDGET